MPKPSDLSDLSIKELEALKNEVEKAIASFEDRRKRDALAAAQKIAEEHGFKLDDLVGPKKSKPAKAPKYQNPDDPTQTWTGHGRRPNWFLACLEAGKTEDDLLI